MMGPLCADPKTRGRWEGIMGERREGFSGTIYKGHMDKTKEGWKQGREVGMDGGIGGG